MPTRGQTKDILIPPFMDKDSDKSEVLFPMHTDVRNGGITSSGGWRKNPGYAQKWDLGTDKPTDLLIPVGNGYAVSEDGRIFKNLKTTIAEMTGRKLNGAHRPQYIPFAGTKLALFDGGNPVKVDISAGTTALLGGSPSKFKYITFINSYAVGAGHNDYGFEWCNSGDIEDWSGGDSGFSVVKQDGQKNKNVHAFLEELYVFKEDSVELYVLTGTSAVFTRIDSRSIWGTGLGASYSVVEADTLYWMDKNRRIFKLTGGAPTYISKSIQQYLDDNLNNYADLVGFWCEKENCIRWTCLADGITIKYDVFNEHLSFENRWYGAGWQALPFASYMELDGDQYFGDAGATGLIFRWDREYYDYNGEAIRCFREWTVRNSDRGRKSRYNKVRFFIKRGVRNSSVETPKCVFQWRFDNTGSWNEVEIDMGDYGDLKRYVDVYGKGSLGHGVEMNCRLIETDATEFIANEGKLTARELGN